MIMEYQKIINLSYKTSNQPSKFKTKNWVEIDDKSRGTYNRDNQIRFETSMLRSSFCDYRDAYILVIETITVENKAAQGQPNNSTNEKVIFKCCASFINCINRINITQVDDAHDTDVVMSMYDLIEYHDNYTKASGVLLQYSKDDPYINPADDKTDIYYECKIDIYYY